MAAPRSLAERFRANREAFSLALELGCTPAEARAELDRRETRAKWKETSSRLAARKAGLPPPRPAPASDHEEQRLPWWQRD